MDRYLLFIVSLSLFLVSVNAAADDAVEAAPAKDLVFEKTNDLIMQNETLILHKLTDTGVSSKGNFLVDVDFQFKNISNQPVVRKIAFVLPPVWCSDEHNSMWGGLDLKAHEREGADDAGFRDYLVTVDDQVVSYTKRSEAIVNNTNISKLLAQHNIPQNPCKIQRDAQGLPTGKYKELQNYNLYDENNNPKWTQQIFFEWTQTFPPATVVHIHHRYTPIAGETVPSLYSAADINKEFAENETPIWNRNVESLATDNPLLTKKPVHTDPENQSPRFCVIPTWIRYQLTTGAYWNGGIRHFKLIVSSDTASPFAINKFFSDDNNVKMTTDNGSMIFTADNFVPKQDLYGLFLIQPQSSETFKICGL